MELIVKVLARIDRGVCAAARGGGPEFVSEIYYGPKDTTSGNIGDSYTAMGILLLRCYFLKLLARIAWFDSYARRFVGDLSTFNDRILAPLQSDLIQYTWLHER